MQLSPYVILHLLSAVFLGGLAVYCWLYRTVPVAATIAQVLLLCAGLALDYAFDLSSFTLADKLFWMKGRFFFLAVIPVLWLVMIVRYVGQEALVTRRRLILLFVVPAITVILAWTSDHHTLFRYNYHLDDSGFFPILLCSSGPWYWFHLCYSYGLFAASLILLLLSLRNAQSFYRRQSLMIIGGAFLPVVGDAVFHTNIPQLPGYIISSVIIFIAGALIVWALFHYALLNVVPIARSVVLEKMSDIMIILDGRNHVVDFNAAAREVLGLQTEQNIGKPLDVLLSRWPELLLHCAKLQCINDTVQLSDGSDRRFYDLSITPIHNRRDEVTGHVIILSDITERQTAEVALRESEATLRTLINAPTDSVFLMDTKGVILDLNDVAAERLGRNRIELIGDLADNSLPANLARERRLLITRVLETGKVVRFEDRRDGICFDVVAYPIKDHDDKVIKIAVIARDITERKRVEEEKKNLEERLQRAEKMEALGTLAGGVAHDLNNVLGVIVGYAELLLNEVDKLSPSRPRLTNIMKGSEKAAAIVQDLLTLARRGVSGRKVLPLNKLILDYQDSPEFEKLSSNHSAVRIKIDLEPDLLNISGSSIHLGKALSNLLINAVEAMPKGGDVTIKTANQYLDKPIYGYDEVREGDYVVLSITDTGEGIPESNLKRIFEPFYTKKVMGRSGTGLGLAVVWGTVKDHQGYINVQSKEGKGSMFTLYFPVTRENVTAEAASVAISEYTGKGETILVVDDVIEQRDLAAEMLKKLNYTVASIASGEGAIAYMKEHNVDLLVLDMIMDPGIDGLDTYMGILEVHPKQKAIIVSGFSETDRVHAAQVLGAGEYVKKPYVLERLGLAVRKELDRSV